MVKIENFYRLVLKWHDGKYYFITYPGKDVMAELEENRIYKVPDSDIVFSMREDYIWIGKIREIPELYS